MMTQGLLVKKPNGEEYLLTTELNRGTRRHRLVVVTKVNGQWKPLEGVQESGCREAMIGALVDFVVDLCRVLNSSDHQPASMGAPTQARVSGGRRRTESALLRHRRRK
ncbi:MAG TPA: hypothetical protein PKD12_11040 [Nitrospira sp.]|nr:hypothetical protein [Nitrospira sp.]